MGKAYDIVGKKFGRYTVLERAKNRNTRQSWWKCRCSCGIVKEVRGIKLVNNEILSCGCWQKDKDHFNTWQWNGYQEISGRYWSVLKKSAAKRNYIFSITIEEAWKKYEDQNKKCVFTGEDIFFVRNHVKEGSKQTASLDRIDSNSGYISGNIQWVHKDVNRLKCDFEENKFLELCFKISNFKQSNYNK